MKKLVGLLWCVFSVFSNDEDIKGSKPTIIKPTPIQVVKEYCTAPLNLILFAPDGGRIYKMILLGLIQTTAVTGSIQVAAFRFTDKDIMNGLIDAHKRGVAVEVIFDPGAMTNTYYSLAFSLCDAGVPVRQYQTTGLLGVAERVKYQSIMHQKTMIFKNTLVNEAGIGRNIVASGSLNFTTAGFYGNEEAVFVLDNPDAIEAFSAHFEKLRMRSYSVEPYRLPKHGLKSLLGARTIVQSVLRFAR